MLACASWSCSARDPAASTHSGPAHCRRRCAAAAAALLQVQMTHSWVSRANALATYAGTVLAVVCLAVTATGGCLPTHMLLLLCTNGACAAASAVPGFQACPCLGGPLYSLADYFHRATPAVHCDFVGTEGLQKEFGHDRVRAARRCCSALWGRSALPPRCCHSC